MKKFNIFTVFLTVVTSVAVSVTPAACALDDPEIQAGSALLVEINTGKILYQKNEDDQVAPGDTAKVMTLLLAVEAIEDGRASLLDTVTPSETFLDGIGEDDDVLGIRTGETMKLQDLLYGAYITAGNGACNIVAEHLAGDIETFVGWMNSKAQLLGCAGTKFSDPSGLDDIEQYTTPWDQYLIFNDAIAHPLFIKIAGTPSYKTDPTDYSRERTLVNTNQMLDSTSAHYYNNCVAGCYDSGGAGGRGFLSYAESGELALIAVLLDAADIEGTDGTMRDQSYFETSRLLEWGFTGFTWQVVLDETEILRRVRVELADGTGDVELRPDRTISVLARTDLEPEDIVKQVVVYAQVSGRPLTAPIGAGAVLGEVTVIIDGNACGHAELVAVREVGLNEKMFIESHVRDTLNIPWVQMCIGALLLLVLGYAVFVVRDIRRRRQRRRALEEMKRKIIEDRKSHEKFYQ